MKVLFSTHPYSLQNPGGGEQIIFSLKKELEKKFNLNIQIGTAEQAVSSSYDLIHEFSLLQWKEWHKYKSPFFLTPTCWPRNDFFSALKFQTKEWIKKSAGQSTITTALKLPKKIFPSTELEQSRMTKYYNLSSDLFLSIPNGTNIHLTKIEGNPFFEKFKIKDYVLFVGRITPVKNLLSLILACKKIQTKLVIVGGSDSAHLDYYNKCHSISDHNVIYAGKLESNSPLLASAYENAKVVCIPSQFETFSLAGIEAGALGKNLIITSEGGTRSVYQDFADYINPSETALLAPLIQKNLMLSGKNNKFRDHVLLNYTWDKIAEKIWAEYNK